MHASTRLLILLTAFFPLTLHPAGAAKSVRRYICIPYPVATPETPEPKPGNPMPLQLTFTPNGDFKGGVKILFSFKGRLKGAKGKAETRFLLSHLPNLAEKIPPVILSEVIKEGKNLRFNPQGEAASQGPLVCQSADADTFKQNEKALVETMDLILGMADKSVMFNCRSHLEKLAQVNADYFRDNNKNLTDKTTLLNQAKLSPEELEELSSTCGKWKLGPVKKKKNLFAITGYPVVSSGNKKCSLTALADKNGVSKILTAKACPAK